MIDKSMNELLTGILVGRGETEEFLNAEGGPLW